MRYLLRPVKWIILPVLIMSTEAAAAEPAPEKPGLVKVAAVQINGYDKGDLPRDGYDPAGSLVPYIERAGNDGAKLVVFPEYVLGHIAVPGPESDKIAAVARAHGIHVIVGCWERLADGSFANTALVFDRQGTVVGRYRKTHPAIDHYEGDQPWRSPPAGKSRDWMMRNDPEWIMRRGEDLPVFDLEFGRVGILICYDGWFPEPARVLSLRGAELIVWINGRGGVVEDFIMRSVMFQSHVAMIATNQAYGGGTMIGDGRVLVRSPDREESYVTGTINLGRVRTRRSSSRNFAQRRPDLYEDLTAPDRPVPGMPRERKRE